MNATARPQLVAERGADCELEPPRTCPLHISANQETRSNEASGGWNRRVKVGGDFTQNTAAAADSDSTRKDGNWRSERKQKHAN